MFDQLQSIARENLQGISRSLPEAHDLDSKHVTEATSQTIVNLIMQQARRGNVLGLREMLSGKPTNTDHVAIRRFIEPVSSQLQTRLNISESSARLLASMSLPIIMNMLNHKVQQKQTGGIDIHGTINTIRKSSGGILNDVFSIFGNRAQNSKLIDGILQNVIS